MSVHSDRLIVDLIIVNGNIHTGDPHQPHAQALAVQGEIIVAVGSDEDVRRLARPATQVIDAEQRLIVPGFNDAHVHFIAGAEELVGVDLRPSHDEGDLAARLARYAAAQAGGEWITGGYWDHEAWARQALPTRASIDAVTPNHPVFVKRLDGHMALANSLAMTLAGISDETPVPSGGAVVRDSQGRLTGLFKDAAMDLVTRAMPPATFDTILLKARAALDHAAALGVTSVQDMTASAAELAAYEALLEAGELTTRISSIQMYDGDRRLERGGDFGRAEWLSSGGRKFFADGSMGASTAAFFAPYADDPATSGLLIHDPDRLEQLIVDADAAGVQPVIHAIGDRANALVLDILERRYAARGISRRWRPRIEHAQVVRPEDRARFRALGVVASIQPSHAIDDMRWAEARIGTARSAMAYNCQVVRGRRRASRVRDRLVRRAPQPDGRPLRGRHAPVPRRDSARGMVSGRAHHAGASRRLLHARLCLRPVRREPEGQSEAGFLADAVMLSRNIFEIPPREILETRPVLTMVGGRVVFDARHAGSPGATRQHAVTSGLGKSG